MGLRIRAKAARLTCVVCRSIIEGAGWRTCSHACLCLWHDGPRKALRMRRLRTERRAARIAADGRAIASAEALARADAEIAARLLWARALLSESEEQGDR